VTNSATIYIYIKPYVSLIVLSLGVVPVLLYEVLLTSCRVSKSAYRLAERGPRYLCSCIIHLLCFHLRFALLTRGIMVETTKVT
jgi:formate-dependent nitrite reductase membrane component NrfD